MCAAYQRLEEGETQGIDPALASVHPSNVPVSKPRWGELIGFSAAILIGGRICLNFIGVGFAFTEGSVHTLGALLVGIAVIAMVSAP